MNDNIILQINNLNEWQDKLINEINEYGEKIELLCRLYDNPKQSKEKDDIYEKITNLYCKLDDYEMQLYDLLGYHINDIFDCCEYGEAITKNAIRKVNTSKKYIYSFLDKLNRNVIKVQNICISEGLDYNEYCSKALLHNINDYKNEYGKIVDEIIKEYNKGGDM